MEYGTIKKNLRLYLRHDKLIYLLILMHDINPHRFTATQFLEDVGSQTKCQNMFCMPHFAVF